MTAKRSSTKSGSAGSSASPDRAILNAVLVLAAIGLGLLILVQEGRLSWPPYQLLASIGKLAGCLALVGPLVLARPDASRVGLGELLWMTGGILIWLFDVVGAVQGQWRTLNWATPLGDRTMGLTMLAVLIAGWRCGLVGRSWAWTNVTGWTLGLLWVGLAACSWVLRPGLWPGLAIR
jgi:hypothetical protein